MKKKFGVALIAILASYAIILSLFLGALPTNVASMPPSPVTFSWETLKTNTTPGESISINCTVFNTSYNESAKTGFHVLLAAINNESYWLNCSLWKEIFTPTFSTNKLVLEPRENQTVTMTLTLASDAPIGMYSFALQGFRNHLKLDVTPQLI